MVVNAALAYLPQVQIKSRCNAFELRPHNMEALKLQHGRKIKPKAKCKAYVSLTFALRANAGC